MLNLGKNKDTELLCPFFSMANPQSSDWVKCKGAECALWIYEPHPHENFYGHCGLVRENA